MFRSLLMNHNWSYWPFRDAALHSLFVTSDYLTSCRLSAVYFDLWPLTPTRPFPPHSCHLLDISSVWDHTTLETLEVVDDVVKAQWMSGNNHSPRSESLQSSFFLVLKLSLIFWEPSLSKLERWDLLHSVWVADCPFWFSDSLNSDWLNESWIPCWWETTWFCFNCWEIQSDSHQCWPVRFSTFPFLPIFSDSFFCILCFSS